MQIDLLRVVRIVNRRVLLQTTREAWRGNVAVISVDHRQGTTCYNHEYIGVLLVDSVLN